MPRGAAHIAGNLRRRNDDAKAAVGRITGELAGLAATTTTPAAA